MRIVVTGALGHIGSRLIRELPASFSDAKIVMIDNLSTQRFPSLFNLPPNGSYQLLEADVLTASLEPIFSGAQVVIHLAAITNAAGSFAIKEKIEHENFTGTERVAKACMNTGSALIFLSSTSVYGTQREVVDEDCSPSELQPQSPYAETKLREEQLVTRLGEAQGLPFIICRFGTIFGTSPGMRFHTAVNKFCWQAVMGQPMTVWRTAFHQRRPYLDVGDAVAAIQFIIARRLFDRRIYNVLTTNATVSDIVEMIKAHVRDLAVQFVDTEIMDQLSYTVSNARFVGQGFTFQGRLEQGIADTICLLRGANGAATQLSSSQCEAASSGAQRSFKVTD